MVTINLEFRHVPTKIVFAGVVHRHGLTIAARVVERIVNAYFTRYTTGVWIRGAKPIEGCDNIEPSSIASGPESPLSQDIMQFNLR